MSPSPTPFNQHLERERQKRGLSIQHIAKCAGVSESEFKLWTSGKALPSKVQIRRMLGERNQLEHYLPSSPPASAGPDRLTPPALPAAAPGSLGAIALAMNKAGVTSIAPSVPASAIVAAPGSPPPVVVPVPVALPWNEILRAWRKENGLTIIDLGDLLDVDGSTVSNWETGKFAPISSHLNKLRGLVPALADVVVPESKHVAKPGRAAGWTPSSPAPIVPAPSPVLAVTVDPLTAIDRVLLAFDSLGQSVSLAAPERVDGVWSMKMVDGTGPDAATIAIGCGPSMSAAALDMLGALRSGIDARRVSTSAIVRSATARLEAQTKALGAIDGALGIGGDR